MQQSGGADCTDCTDCTDCSGCGTTTRTRRASDDRPRRCARREHSHHGPNAGGRPSPQAHGHRRGGGWQK
jgi:hypothetical protein